MKNLETIDDMLNLLPKELYAGGLYMHYYLGGMWCCGYDKSVHHTCDNDLKVALCDLLKELKEIGYYEILDSER